MKARTKVILGVVAALAFTLAATRAARKAKWERWVAEQEFKFQQARFVTPASCRRLPCSNRGKGATGTGDPAREVAVTDQRQLTNERRRQDAGATHEHHGAATAAMSGGHHQHMEMYMRWFAGADRRPPATDHRPPALAADGASGALRGAVHIFAQVHQSKESVEYARFQLVGHAQAAGGGAGQQLAVLGDEAANFRATILRGGPGDGFAAHLSARLLHRGQEMRQALHR